MPKYFFLIFLCAFSYSVSNRFVDLYFPDLIVSQYRRNYFFKILYMYTEFFTITIVVHNNITKVTYRDNQIDKVLIS